jgi:hypothetical protein
MVMTWSSNREIRGGGSPEVTRIIIFSIVSFTVTKIQQMNGATKCNTAKCPSAKADLSSKMSFAIF